MGTPGGVAAAAVGQACAGEVMAAVWEVWSGGTVSWCTTHGWRRVGW